MAKTSHPRRAVNDDLVLAALDRRMAGHGNGKKTALEMDVSYSHLRSMRAGNEPVSMKVAEALEFELRWVPKK
jgi:hypothetical protein